MRTLHPLFLSYDPGREFELVRRGFERLLTELDASLGSGPQRREARLDPRHDVRFEVHDEGAAYLVRADVPGMDASALQVDVTRDTLTLKGQRKVPRPEGYSAHRVERAELSFARTITFPAKVEPEQVRADLRDGVLTVRLAKRADEQPRTIAVNVVSQG